MPKARLLIKKHGMRATIDSAPVKMFIDKHRVSELRRPNNKVIPYIKTKVVLTLSQIPLNSIIELMGKSYRVWEQTEEVYDKNKLLFCATMIFEDEFVNEVKLYEQSLATSGCNLPEHALQPHLTANAQIRTQSVTKLLEMPIVTDKVITHIFTVFFAEGIERTNLLIWNDRHFEVLGVENVNEKNRILELSCAESL